MKLTEKEFNWIVEYMHNRYGIELGHKRVLIEGRLENYLLKNGYTSYGEFINRIASSPDGGRGRRHDKYTDDKSYILYA